MFLDEVIGAQARGRTGVGEVVEEENGAVLVGCAPLEVASPDARVEVHEARLWEVCQETLDGADGRGKPEELAAGTVESCGMRHYGRSHAPCGSPTDPFPTFRSTCQSASQGEGSRSCTTPAPVRLPHGAPGVLKSQAGELAS